MIALNQCLSTKLRLQRWTLNQIQVAEGVDHVSCVCLMRAGGCCCFHIYTRILNQNPKHTFPLLLNAPGAFPLLLVATGYSCLRLSAPDCSSHAIDEVEWLLTATCTGTLDGIHGTRIPFLTDRSRRALTVSVRCRARLLPEGTPCHRL